MTMKIRNEIERDAPLTNVEKAALGLFALWPILAILAIGALCNGCAYRGGKVVEGTDLAVGISVPATDGTIDLNVMNYMSGFRLGVDRNAIFRVKYTIDEDNAYLGIATIKSKKTIDATVEPCENSVETQP